MRLLAWVTFHPMIPPYYVWHSELCLGLDESDTELVGYGAGTEFPTQVGCSAVRCD